MSRQTQHLQIPITILFIKICESRQTNIHKFQIKTLTIDTCVGKLRKTTPWTHALTPLLNFWFVDIFLST